MQHPTLLSQSLSGPLEAAAPFLHDAASLPHAQVVLTFRLFVSLHRSICSCHTYFHVSSRNHSNTDVYHPVSLLGVGHDYCTLW